MMKLDVRAWVVWVLAVALIALLTRNPLYLVLLLLITRLVAYACRPPQPVAWQLPFWRLAVAVLVFSTLFNMLMAHVGSTVLFSLPERWWLIGGPLTLEAAVFGFISGLSLVTLLSAFLAFNAIVPSSELTRLMPPALHEVGLVLLVAITYVPETVRQWERVREAQLIRGHQVRSLTDWQPLLIPLLIGGLERSLTLSEAMVARGYGATQDVPAGWTTRLLFVAGLLLALGGAVGLAWGNSIGWAFVASGAVLIGVAYGLVTQRVKQTRYRPHRWGWADTVVALSAAAAVLLIRIPGWLSAQNTLFYTPYPALTWPPFDPFVGLALLLLTAPALLEMLS